MHCYLLVFFSFLFQCVLRFKEQEGKTLLPQKVYALIATNVKIILDNQEKNPSFTRVHTYYHVNKVDKPTQFFKKSTCTFCPNRVSVKFITINSAFHMNRQISFPDGYMYDCFEVNMAIA